ncbi:MAG: DUF167 domain-containing protein [Sphingobium sp.]|nr:DUF167 domain-containing protein [Sphingobium sp.]
MRLTPGAQRERLGGLWTDAGGDAWLAASVRAAPEKGRANVALIALLADRLGCPKSMFSLESGNTNRLKRVRIIGGADRMPTDRITALFKPEADAS